MVGAGKYEINDEANNVAEDDEQSVLLALKQLAESAN
jgi:hypothetical protein